MTRSELLTRYMNRELYQVDPSEVGGYLGVEARIVERMDERGIIYGSSGPGDLALVEVLAGCKMAPVGARFWTAMQHLTLAN